MTNIKDSIFNKLEKGINIGREGALLAWGIELSKIKNNCEVYNEKYGEPNHIYFGNKTIFPNIELGLYTPFDTLKDNRGTTVLNHVGQNLGEDSLLKLIFELNKILGEPNEKSTSYGTYMKWEDNFSYIEIIPSSHHGSDWNAIIIGTKMDFKNN